MEELKWVTLGSVLGSMVFLRTIREYIPSRFWSYIEKYIQKLMHYVYPYTVIIFDEYSDDRFNRSQVFSRIQTYLSANASVQTQARRFKADIFKDSKSLLLSMDDRQEIPDEFEGVKVWWELITIHPRREYNPYSFYPPSDEKKSYKLTFHKRHLELIKTDYISHVLTEGKATIVKNRQRMLYSNSSNKNGHWRPRRWSNIYFEHPANFDTLAMETKKKEEIKKDLLKFSKGKEYYKKIGKAWKRGYLLHGPPGTGKSTMVAAMANFLDYDVYDLELTTVSNNTELRSLLIEVPGKSILVIEDIDCSLDLTGQRQKKKEKDGEGEEMDPIKKKAKEESENKQSQVTLSGLLNVIDGIWSACGGERIVVFTTNYKEKLDPALIRRGRMDKHIEMSYCSFESFKVLANNYLDIDSHELYAEISRLLGEINMTPADVAENLMPKSDEEDVETCLTNLIEALKVEKEDQARKKAEEEARLKAEKEEKEDAEGNVKHEETPAKNPVKENGLMAKEDKGGGT